MKDGIYLLLAGLICAGLGWAMYHYLDHWMFVVGMVCVIYVLWSRRPTLPERKRIQREAEEREGAAGE